jgi:hypothetical protein
MGAREHVLGSHDGIAASKRRLISQFSAGHRIAGAFVVLIVVMLGTVPWLVSGRDASGLEAPRQDATASGAAGTFEFEYFPGRYVNQAKEVEEHIQAY